MDLDYCKLLKEEDWIKKVKSIDIKYLRDTMDCKCIFKTDGCQYGNKDISNLRKHIKVCKFRNKEELGDSYCCLSNPNFWRYLGDEEKTITGCGVSILKIWKIPRERWKTQNLTHMLIIHLLDRKRLKGTLKRHTLDSTIMIYDGSNWLHKKNNELLWRAELLHFKITCFYPFIEQVICERLRWQHDEPITNLLLEEMQGIGYDTNNLLSKIDNYDKL